MNCAAAAFTGLTNINANVRSTPKLAPLSAHCIERSNKRSGVRDYETRENDGCWNSAGTCRTACNPGERGSGGNGRSEQRGGCAARRRESALAPVPPLPLAAGIPALPWWRRQLWRLWSGRAALHRSEPPGTSAAPPASSLIDYCEGALPRLVGALLHACLDRPKHDTAQLTASAEPGVKVNVGDLARPRSPTRLGATIECVSRDFIDHGDHRERRWDHHPRAGECS